MVALQGQVTEMSKLLQSMVLAQVNVVSSSVHVVKHVAEMDCVGCSGSYNTDVCPFNTKMITYAKNDPYSNTYNGGWRNHSNFSWGGTGQDNQGRQGDQEHYRGKVSGHCYRHYDKPHHLAPQHQQATTTTPSLLWNPFFLSICRGMMHFYRAKSHQSTIWSYS